MKLTDSDVLELAGSERIKLDPAEIPQLRDDLNSILEFASVLHELPGDAQASADTESSPHPKGMNLLRDDTVRPSLAQAEALAPAPAAEDGFFRVPRTVDSEGA
jgi:aspartyl-tRNA(Asn)/glutamyl-tRNA(Gln) amidotransferase subunit C